MKTHARVITRMLIGLLMASVLAVVGAGTAQAGGLAAPAKGATVSNAPRTATVAAAEFSAGGRWQLTQSNGPTVALNLVQDGSGRLYGTASCCGGIVGTIEEGGLVDGKDIFFTIGWSNGARGRYTGSLGHDRRLSGFSFDLNNPSSQATWFSDRVF